MPNKRNQNLRYYQRGITEWGNKHRRNKSNGIRFGEATKPGPPEYQRTNKATTEANDPPLTLSPAQNLQNRNWR